MLAHQHDDQASHHQHYKQQQALCQRRDHGVVLGVRSYSSPASAGDLAPAFPSSHPPPYPTVPRANYPSPMTTPTAAGPETATRKAAPSPYDLEIEKQKYKSRLAELTFNSKPIINMLTSAAQDRIYAARQIVQAIEEHLRSVDPSIKLCMMYLVDSICKNVGGAYIPLFARNMVHTYLDVYAVVDEETQGKLERVLGTWRHGPTGRPVFDLSLVSAIEHGVAKKKNASTSAGKRGDHEHILPAQVGHIPLSMHGQQWPSASVYNNSYPHDSHSSYPRPPVSSVAYGQGYPPHETLPLSIPVPEALADRTSILSEMQALLNITQQKASQGDPMAAMRVGVLQQLQGVVHSHQLPPSQLLQVKQNLSSLWAQAELTPTPTPPRSQQLQFSYAAAAAPVAPLTPLLQSNPQLQQYPAISTITPVPIARSPSATPPPPAPAGIPTGLTPSAGVTLPPADLVKSLMSFGLLSSAGSSQNYGRAQSYAFAPPSRKAETLADLGPIELTNESIQRRREGAAEILYEAFPLQCKQCGFRFRKTPEGQSKMDEHLDWHFRQNRRAKDKAAKSQSRGWFVAEEDWIHSREGGAANQEHAPFFNASQVSAKASAEAEAAKAEENALRQQTIIQPDAEAAGKPCPICKEAFENFYNDAEEEWCLRNAVDVAGVVYHATCHADAKKNELASSAPPSPREVPEAEPAVAKAPEENEDVLVKKEQEDDAPDVLFPVMDERESPNASVLRKRKASDDDELDDVKPGSKHRVVQ